MWGASAVVLGNSIYVSGGESPNEFASHFVFAYHILKNHWERLPELSHSHGVPVVAANKLYIIGGKSKKGEKYTNQVSRYDENKWNPFPSLKKERFGPLVVTYNDHIIVGGGKYTTKLPPFYDNSHDDIEVFNIKDPDMKWRSIPTRLPLRMWAPSATISDNQLLIAGFNGEQWYHFRKDVRSDEVYYITLPDILATAENKTKSWRCLPRYVPYYSAAVVPNSSPLVLVGGDTKDSKIVSNALVKLNPSNDHWDSIASLDGPPRAYATVTCIGEQQQAIFVMGGCTKTDDESLRNIRSSGSVRNSNCLDLVQIGFVA